MANAILSIEAEPYALPEYLFHLINTFSILSKLPVELIVKMHKNRINLRYKSNLPPSNFYEIGIFYHLIEKCIVL